MIRLLYKTWLCVMVMLLATAVQGATIKDLRYNRLNDKAQLIISADGLLRFEHFTLSNPPRLVVDIIGGVRHGSMGLDINEGAIEKVRTGYHARTNYRIVVDLNYPARGRVYTKIMPDHRNNQLFIDIYEDKSAHSAPQNHPRPFRPSQPSQPSQPSSQSSLGLESLNRPANNPLATAGSQASPAPPPAVQVNPLPAPQAPNSPLFSSASGSGSVSAPSPVPAPTPLFVDPPRQPMPTPSAVITPPAQAPKMPTPPFRPKREIVIAIDPGHGGKDPGAISRATGLREKDVVLQIAHRLKQRIDERAGFRAVLTRDRDIFIPLHQRAAIARRYNADLFVSIHADAVRSVEPSGSSVYILSTKGATSQLAKYLESSENAVDLRWGVDVSKYNDDIQEALFTIQQEATLESSFILAERTLNELKALGKVHKASVERANFVVLRSPEIPSMLVETAFISNPQEARKLATPSYQDRLAVGIANGIFRYFSEYLPQHILLGQ